MLSFREPTPCPQPRHYAPRKHRLSLVDRTDPTTTLLAAPRLPGLRDGKPRRPKIRQSIGWDPMQDIYEDPISLDNPSLEKPVLPANILGPESSQLQLDKTSGRRDTLFSQPAQKKPLQSSQGAEGSSPQKRRLSSATGHGARTHDNSQAKKVISEQSCALRKEARRRTIYVPNDTTILTIHPGAPVYQKESKAQRPRKSDTFLDPATLNEEKSDSLCFPGSSQGARVAKRANRDSLSVAPRRVPLQITQRQFQPQASVRDVAGDGGGKENVPPGGHAKISKGLGKCAILLDPGETLAPVGEQSKIGSELPEKGHGQAPCSNDVSVKTVNIPSTSTFFKANPGRGSVPTNSKYTIRRSSLLIPDTKFPQSKTIQKVPKSLRAPDTGFRRSAFIQESAPLLEDIMHPELYEERWLSHQEQTVSQLVNKLFNRGNRSDIIGSTPLCLRQKLLNLYQSSENVLLHKRLQASLRFGALSIPSHTLTEVVRLKSDFGLRQRFLDLWLKTYDVESLQIAAEIVIGRRRVSSPHNSGNDHLTGSKSSHQNFKSTQKFLQAFLIQNQDLETHQSINMAHTQSPSRGKSKKPSSQHATQIWRQTALRSLMLIHLLDMAQRCGLFSGRNLFHSSSPYKSSSAALQGLCRLLIPSIGDVSRVLGHLGFYVKHIQYPLEEFSYELSNLATDMRDGVRLTRLTECLLYPHDSFNLEGDEITTTLPCGDILISKFEYNGNQGAVWPLSQHLKLPAVGRSQCIYNVEIALAALRSVEGVESQLIQDLNAADIVDGHREKTVRLLWGLVSRWGLGILVDFTLLDGETERLRRIHLRRRTVGMSCNDVDSELPYLSGPERHSRALQEWARRVGDLHDVKVYNLTTSFADGQLYEAIGHEYSAAINIRVEGGTENTSLPIILDSFGCSKTFASLFTTPCTSPSETTTTSLLAFLASRILPVAVPHHAALTIQRAYRTHYVRWDTNRRSVLKRLAEECMQVVAGREQLIRAVRILQIWWRRCLGKRRRGVRKWV